MEDRDVIETLRRTLDGTSHAAWARAHGLTPQFVSAVLCGRKPPTTAIARALGLHARRVLVAVWQPDQLDEPSADAAEEVRT